MKKALLAIVLALFIAGPDAHAQFSGKDWRMWETYGQLVTIPADVLLVLLGARTEDSAGSIIASAALATASMELFCQGTKRLIIEERPDGGFLSFPSGHTAAAFTGAELIRLHYGWGWGAGAYALATAVGVSRVVHRRHWWWDVAAGAALGVACANLSVKCCRAWFAPKVDPQSGALCLGVACCF